MYSAICLRLLAAALCLTISLPLAASEQRAPTIGEQREVVLFWPQAQREAQFRRMGKLFPSDRAAHGTHVHELPQGQTLALGGQGGSAWLTSYMDEHHIAGVMVLQRGRIRLQRYALGFGPEQRWESFSVAKSVTSTLLGIALQRGDIRSLDDTLGTYIPELRDSAYADVTVQQLLTMTSGVHWNEDYADAKSDVAQMYLGACVDGQAHVLSYLKKQPRQWPAGTHWNYNTAETDLLGILVQRATRRSLAAYLSQTIWQPYGMAADAYWIKDECDGSDTGGSGLSATLGDYARIGQFMLDGGRIDGKPVIAAAWLQGAVRSQASVDAPDRGYGYLWWTDIDGSYAAIGIFGQMVYVDPARQLVIAQVGAWPHATSKALVAARREFVAAIKRAVDAERQPATH
ncbi:serine hydrolase [Rhodanobacter sp. FW510-R12]|uniref:serine hydrolase domain-containing protein n=1 Tax=unclassified Rhodanobacter TaxID=2621553 RepID=UPI0007A9B778|nr:MULTISPECIES: serine hydrolase [unclassified Rhodanobacter]KZC17283.1 serine hydrolase [Rhodanobacter sp. FW104-R8]KZC26229.1 serine hydrolase [Rhodanobacter sp. FW510-T8]KZC29336.1 serine hydrolase [Rhodanobacter sp. FW510-R10]